MPRRAGMCACSRRRVRLIFLLIRYTGARLNEVLALDPSTDIDCDERLIRFGGVQPDREGDFRRVQISETLTDRASGGLGRPRIQRNDRDPPRGRSGLRAPQVLRAGRGLRAGQASRSGPEMVRRARAVELLQAKMPLAAVEKMLGTSMPQRAAARICFSPEEIEQATRCFVEREASRKTSARNTFFGKIVSIRRGDIQARVTLVTVGGQEVSTVITNDSLERLGLMVGGLIAAEVKAPWVILYRGRARAGL